MYDDIFLTLFQGFHNILGISGNQHSWSRLDSEHQCFLARPGELHIVSIEADAHTFIQKHYLDHHAWESEIIQSFVPTILTAVLTLLIPPLLRTSLHLSQIIALLTLCE